VGRCTSSGPRPSLPCAPTLGATEPGRAASGCWPHLSLLHALQICGSPGWSNGPVVIEETPLKQPHLHPTAEGAQIRWTDLRTDVSPADEAEDTLFMDWYRYVDSFLVPPELSTL
jgi:hypothetical protein